MEKNIFADSAMKKQLKITSLDRDTPVYIEVYRRIQRLIREGRLSFGDQLPGEHELAALLGVGRTSLRTALSLLYEDGYIRTQKGKGSYVCFDSRQEKCEKKSERSKGEPPKEECLKSEKKPEELPPQSQLTMVLSEAAAGT